MSSLLNTITIAAAVMSAAGAAAAESGRESFSLEFRYNTSATVEDNYSRFLHDVREACTTQGARPLAMIVLQRACVQDVMDQLVARMGRADLAAVHVQRTGRQGDASRDFAAK